MEVFRHSWKEGKSYFYSRKLLISLKTIRRNFQINDFDKFVNKIKLTSELLS